MRLNLRGYLVTYSYDNDDLWEENNDNDTIIQQRTAHHAYDLCSALLTRPWAHQTTESLAKYCSLSLSLIRPGCTHVMASTKTHSFSRSIGFPAHAFFLNFLQWLIAPHKQTANWNEVVLRSTARRAVVNLKVRFISRWTENSVVILDELLVDGSVLCFRCNIMHWLHFAWSEANSW